MATKTYTLADGTTATVDADENGVPFNEGMNVLSKAIKAKINASSSGGASSENINVTNSKELIKHFTYEIISGATIESTSDLDCFTIINLNGDAYNEEFYIKLLMDNTKLVFDTAKVYGKVFTIGDSDEVSFHENTNYSGNEHIYYLSIDNSSAVCYIKIIPDDVREHDVSTIFCLLSPSQVINGATPPTCYHLVMLNIHLYGE